MRSATTAAEAPTDDAGRRRAGGTARVVAAVVGLALLWPLLQVLTHGSFDALLAVGEEGPSRSAVEADIPDLYLSEEESGHDGQQFYVISRHPLDPAAAEDAVVPLAYRYRRILYPAVASVLAPQGGRAVIAVFLVESLAGVALGAWALRRLALVTGAPGWLPFTVAVTPGVIAALNLSLSDALGAGLGIAAVAFATERRWWPMIGTLVLAALTRETLLLVAAGLVLTPGMPRRVRAATVAVPTAAFAAWSLWSSHRAAASIGSGGPEQLSVPFAGWFGEHVGASDLALGAAVLLLLVAGAWRIRHQLPHVAAVLVLGALLMVSMSELVTFRWVNSMRPVAPMLPLAVWALVLDRARVGRAGVGRAPAA